MVQCCRNMSPKSYEESELRWWARIEGRQTTIRQGSMILLTTGYIESEAQRARHPDSGTILSVTYIFRDFSHLNFIKGFTYGLVSQGLDPEHVFKPQ